MTVEELIIYGKSQENSMHAKMILADILNVNPLELLTILDQKVGEEEVNLYKKKLQALKTQKPIQYVIGNVNFCGNTFLVNEHVLIPRFETEELVEKVGEYINQQSFSKVKILDLGCGSGVIGLSLKKKFKDISEVMLVDISTDALEVSKKNAQRLDLKVNFIQSNWLEDVPPSTYDIIVSNPPYIRLNEPIEAIVKDNEPTLALYAGADGLDAYRNILKNIKPYMKHTCLLAFEIGCEQAEAVSNIIRNYLENVDIEIKKDLQGRNRMIFVYYKND